MFAFPFLIQDNISIVSFWLRSHRLRHLLQRRLLCVLVGPLDVVGQVARDRVDPIVRAGRGSAECGVDRDDARPDASQQGLVADIGLLVAREAAADLAAAGDDLHLEDAGALHLGAAGRHAGIAPAVLRHAVGDELQRPQLLGRVRHGRGVPEQRRGPVVVAVGKGRQGQDESVDVAGRDGNGQADRLGSSSRGGFVIVLLSREVHDARGDVAMQVELQDVARVGAGPVERAHLSDHGQRLWKGRVRDCKGDIDQQAGVDDLVDLLERVAG